MQNKYQVKIDDSVIPELYSFDQLIDAGLLDDIDDNIKIRLIGETTWITARRYPFAEMENNSHGQSENHNTNNHYYSSKSGEGQSQSIRYNTKFPKQNYRQPSSPSPSERLSLEYPPIVDKWNWGAFCLSWLWGICNGLYWPLIIIVLNFIPYLGITISLFICLFLGKRGNELAWRNARREGINSDSFALTQSKWNITGIILIKIIIVCALLLTFISIIIR